MLGTGYFLKSQKLIPSKKNQSVLIAKISSHKTQKKRQSAKINSRKNFVPHGIRWKNDRSFDQPGPGRYFWFLLASVQVYKTTFVITNHGYNYVI